MAAADGVAGPVGRARTLAQVYRRAPALARWLRACLGPDQPERVARLEAEMALAATAPPLLLQGDAVEVMPDAFARVPADALPVVTTTWTLSRFPLESRLRFLHRLDEAAAGRWRGCRWRASGSRRRFRRSAIAAPLATASSVWRCSTSRRCARRAPAETAFAHRQPLFQIGHHGLAGYQVDDEERAALIAWVGRSWACFGANVPRLRQVKGRYNPDSMFRSPQSLPLPLTRPRA